MIPFLSLKVPKTFHELKKDDPIELIPDQTVAFDDISFYHTIPMYKTLVAYHIGLTTRHSTNTDKGNNLVIAQDGIYRGSFIKPQEIGNYLRCKKRETISFPIKEDIEFQHLLIHDSFSLDRKYKIHVVSKGLTLFILFPHAYAEENNTRIDSVVVERFFIFMDRLKTILPHMTQLVCMGHSAGMRHATLCAFLLSCIKNTDFFLRHASLFENPDGFEASRGIIGRFDKKIYVVGTGGAPYILNKERFRDFYEELGGRYVHIYSALETGTTFYIDYVAANNFSHEELKSFKFGIYSSSSIDMFTKYNLDTCTIGVGIFISNGQDEIQHFISTHCKNTNESEDISSYFGEDCNKIIHHLHEFYTYRNLLSIFMFNTLKEYEGTKRNRIKRNTTKRNTTKRNRTKINTTKRKSKPLKGKTKK